MPQPKLRARKPLWQGTNRPVYGTVFGTHSVEEVFSKRKLEAVNRLSRKSGSKVLYRVPAELADKHQMPGRSTGKLWFSPLRRAGSLPIAEHYRSVFGKVGNGFVVFKGAGLSRHSQKFRLSNPRIPFGFSDKREPYTAKFTGGRNHGYASREGEIANAINEAFKGMKARKDPHVSASQILPTFEPIAVLKPLQVPVERARGAEKTRQKNAMELAGVPESEARRQAVLAYHCRTPYRVRDMMIKRVHPFKALAEDIVEAKELREKALRRGSDWVNAWEKLNVAEHWLSMFEVNGMMLEAEHGGLIAREKTKAGWKKIDFTEARIKILDNFVKTFGVGIRTVHKELNGTFRSGGFTAIDVKDVTLAGQIMDLDVVSLNIKDHAEREELQNEDRQNANEVLERFTEMLFPDSGKEFERREIARKARAQLRKIIT